MLVEFVPILILFFLALGLGLLVIALTFIIGPRAPSAVKRSTSGIASGPSSRSSFARDTRSVAAIGTSWIPPLPKSSRATSALSTRINTPRGRTGSALAGA